MTKVSEEKLYRPTEVYCELCGVRLNYDPELDEYWCPNCDEHYDPEDLGIVDPETIEFREKIRRKAEEAWRKHKPGKYFFEYMTAQETAEKYEKLGDGMWRNLWFHDLILAKLRGQEYVLNKLWEARRLVELRLGRTVEEAGKRVERMKQRFEEGFKNLEKAKEWVDKHLCWCVFAFYVEELKVEGWRISEYETLGKGWKRLIATKDPARQLFLEEYHSWGYAGFDSDAKYLSGKLCAHYWNAHKAGDRITAYITKVVLTDYVTPYLGKEDYPGLSDIPMDDYADGIVEEVVKEGKVKHIGFWDWLVLFYWRRAECLAEGKNGYNKWLPGACDDIIAAIGAREHVDFKNSAGYWEPLPDTDKVRDYLEKLVLRFNVPELKELYYKVWKSKDEDAYRRFVEIAKELEVKVAEEFKRKQEAAEKTII